MIFPECASQYSLIILCHTSSFACCTAKYLSNSKPSAKTAIILTSAITGITGLIVQLYHCLPQCNVHKAWTLATWEVGIVTVFITRRLLLSRVPTAPMGFSTSHDQITDWSSQDQVMCVVFRRTEQVKHVLYILCCVRQMQHDKQLAPLDTLC